ncbi:hypothetical protein P0136_00205 [Lentisphaerota bacterium ZTH]|nr:hypothetical protein JYG24_08650 [Lentisphaerota bacterium]WET06438.1 hypothetical protein P0136_00205 [Lentisphaerota bacterium ZTH]
MTLGLIVLGLAVIGIIALVAWSCRIIDRLNSGEEKTSRQIIKEQQNGSQD